MDNIVIEIKGEKLEVSPRLAVMLNMALCTAKPHLRDGVTREWMTKIQEKLSIKLL